MTEPAANPQAGVTEEMVQAVARSDAEFDKRPFGSLGRIDRERYTERARKALTAALSLSRPAADRGQIEACPFCGGDELNLADNEYRSRAIARLNNIARGQIVEECARVADNYPTKAEPNDRGVGLLRELVSSNIAAAIRALSPAPAQTEE